MKTRLFIALYNANLFRLTDREKRVEMIRQVAEIVPVPVELLVKKLSCGQQTEQGEDLVPGPQQAQLVVEALAKVLMTKLGKGLETSNPEYKWDTSELTFFTEDGVDEGVVIDIDEMIDTQPPKESLPSVSVPPTLPVDVIMVDRDHFRPQDLPVEELIDELLVFKEAGVVAENELVNDFLDLF